MSRHSPPIPSEQRQTEAEASVRSRREDPVTPTATFSTSSYFTASSSPYVSPYSPRTTAETLPARTVTSTSNLYPSAGSAINSGTVSAAMSTYSSSSQDSLYSSPGPQHYQVVTPGMINNPQNLSAVSAIRSNLYPASYSRFGRLLYGHWLTFHSDFNRVIL